MRQYWMLLAGLVFAGTAIAAEKSDFNRDKAAMDAATAPAMGGYGADAEALTSLKGNGRVKIGGDVILRYAYARVKDKQHLPTGGKTSTTYHSSDWEADTAELNFEVTACDNGKLFITLDFTDPHDNGFYGQQWDPNAGPIDPITGLPTGAAVANSGYNSTADDLLKEIYFTFENLCGTGFGVTFGKTNTPFGMGTGDVLALSPYMDGMGNSFLNFYRNGVDYTSDQWSGFNWERPHSTYSYDRTYLFMPFFAIEDCLKFEAAIFQDPKGRNQTTRNLRDTSDPGLSFAARLTWTPIEDLTISGSAITRNNRDSDENGEKKRMYATSLGFDWTPCFFDKRFNVFGEWQHAWDVDGGVTHMNREFSADGIFYDDTSSDNIYAGFSFDLTESLTFFNQYEWLRYRSQHTGHSDLFRIIAAAQYTFASGMYVEAGYQHEWAWLNSGFRNNARSNYSGYPGAKAQADVIYTAFGWSF